MSRQETFDGIAKGLMGHEDEYAGKAKLTLLEANYHQENVWNLQHGFDVETHGASHHFVYLSAILGMSDPEMDRIITESKYQGSMEIEQIVVAVENTLKHVTFSQKQYETTAEVKAIIKQGAEENYTVLRRMGDEGNKSAFYLGREQGKTMEQVRQEFEHDDRKITNEACATYMRKLGVDQMSLGTANIMSVDPVLWMNSIKDGSEYEVDGQVQTYQDIPRIPTDSPAFDRMFGRIAHAIIEIQSDMTRNATNENDALSNVTLNDVYVAMLTTPGLDQSKRNHEFERQFGFIAQQSPEVQADLEQS